MIPLPDLRQKHDWDCGPVAVRTFLRAMRRRPNPNAFSLLGTTPIDGTDPRAVETCLRAHGFCVLAGSATWNDLWHLSLSRPVLALITLGQTGHWVTVAGFRSGRIHFQCPSEGPASMGRRAWMRNWRDVDRLGAHYHQWVVTGFRPGSGIPEIPENAKTLGGREF